MTPNCIKLQVLIPMYSFNIKRSFYYSNQIIMHFPPLHIGEDSNQITRVPAKSVVQVLTVNGQTTRSLNSIVQVLYHSIMGAIQTAA